MAVFSESGHPCNLAYGVLIDPQWETRSARLAGFHGNREIDLCIRRMTDGSWRVGLETQHAVAHCVDIDLGFTPATLPRLDHSPSIALRQSWADH